MPFVFRFWPVALLFLAGQVYFLWRGCVLLARWIGNRWSRISAIAALLGIYVAMMTVKPGGLISDASCPIEK